MSVDLRDKCGPVFDQGDLGSSTAAALIFGFKEVQPDGEKRMDTEKPEKAYDLP